jgi:hypothetical protein
MQLGDYYSYNSLHLFFRKNLSKLTDVLYRPGVMFQYAHSLTNGVHLASI